MASLKELLIEFLKDGSQPEGVELKARVLSFEPMFITNDNLHYLEIVHITDNIDTEGLGRNLGIKHYQLVINDWKFVFRRVPTSHEYYFDIQATDFELKEIEDDLDENIEWASLNDDMEIKYLSEVKKRQAIEALLEKDLRSKNFTGSTTPVKISGSVTKMEESDYKSSAKKDFTHRAMALRETGVDDLLRLGDIFENSQQSSAKKFDELDPKIYEGETGKNYRNMKSSGNLRAMNEGEIKKKTGLGIMYEGLKTGLLRLQDLTFPRTTVEHFLNTYETKKRLKVL